MMKIRTDFVTNSSSSSFIIAKKDLDEDQIRAIREHASLGEKLGINYASSDSWDIEENEEYICGSTYIDNFDMDEFLNKIDVNADVIQWEDFDADLDWFMKRFKTEYYDVCNENWRDFLY